MAQNTPFESYGSDLLGDGVGGESDHPRFTIFNGTGAAGGSGTGSRLLFNAAAAAAAAAAVQLPSVASSSLFGQSRQQHLNDAAYQFFGAGVGGVGSGTGAQFLQMRHQMQQQQQQQVTQSQQGLLFRGMLVLLVCEQPESPCQDWIAQTREIVESQDGICMTMHEFSSLQQTPPITHVIVPFNGLNNLQQTLLHLRLALDENAFFVTDKFILDSIRQGFRRDEREYPPFAILTPAVSAANMPSAPSIPSSLGSTMGNMSSLFSSSLDGPSAATSGASASQVTTTSGPSSSNSSYVIPHLYSMQSQQQQYQPVTSSLGLALNWPKITQDGVKQEQTPSSSGSSSSNGTTGLSSIFNQPITGQYVSLNTSSSSLGAAPVQHPAASASLQLPMADVMSAAAKINSDMNNWQSTLEKQQVQKHHAVSAPTTGAGTGSAPMPQVVTAPQPDLQNHPSFQYRDDLDVNIFIKASRDSKFIPQFPEILCTLTWKHKYDVKITTNNPIFRDMDVETIKQNMTICLVLAANRRIPSTKMNVAAMTAASPSVQAALQANNARIAQFAAATSYDGSANDDDSDQQDEEAEDDSGAEESSTGGRSKKRQKKVIAHDGDVMPPPPPASLGTSQSQIIQDTVMHSYREENLQNPTITISNFHKISDREVVARFGVNTTFCSKRFNYYAFRICAQFCPSTMPAETSYFTIFSPEFKTFVKKNAGVLKYLNAPFPLRPQVLLQTVRRGDVIKEASYSGVSEKFSATPATHLSALDAAAAAPVPTTPATDESPVVAPVPKRSQRASKKSNPQAAVPVAPAVAEQPQAAAQGTATPQQQSVPSSVQDTSIQQPSSPSQSSTAVVPNVHDFYEQDVFAQAIARMHGRPMPSGGAEYEQQLHPGLDSPAGSKKRKRDSPPVSGVGGNAQFLSIPALQGATSQQWQQQQPQQGETTATVHHRLNTNAMLEMFAVGPIIFRIGGFAYVRLPQQDSAGGGEARQCICRLVRAFADPNGNLMVICQRFYRRDEIEMVMDVPNSLSPRSQVMHGRELIMSMDRMSVNRYELAAPCQVKYVGDAQVQMMQCLPPYMSLPQEEESRHRLAEDWCVQGQDHFFFYRYAERDSNTGNIIVAPVNETIKRASSGLLVPQVIFDRLFPVLDGMAAPLANSVTSASSFLGLPWQSHATLMQQLVAAAPASASLISTQPANQQATSSSVLASSSALAGQSTFLPLSTSGIYNATATATEQAPQLQQQPQQLLLMQGIPTATVVPQAALPHSFTSFFPHLTTAPAATVSQDPVVAAVAGQGTGGLQLNFTVPSQLQGFLVPHQ